MRKSLASEHRKASGTPPLLVSVGEAAAALNLGLNMIWNLIRDGSLRTVHIGRRRLVVWSSLEAYVASLVEDTSDGNAA